MREWNFYMNNDKKILRALANTYFEIANSDKNHFNIFAHKNVNDLKGDRPIVLIDEIPWHEMNMNDELTLQCSDTFLMEVENELRMTIYKWTHMPADMVVTPYFGVDKILNFSGCGIIRKFNDSEAKNNEEIQAHTFADQFQCEEDVDKLHNEIVTYDEAETLHRYNLLGDIFGDVLPVRIVGVSSGYGSACKIWDDISFYKSLDRIFTDLIDEPELMHKLAGKLTDILIDLYRQYDEMGLWNGDAYYNHCTSALTNDLQIDYANTTRKNIWGRGLAQILASVSPSMQEEFDLPYQIKALQDFGLIYYGCCEPLHNKINVIEKIPNLRKISITPWADVNAATEIMGSKYVVAAKPNPAFLSAKNLDEVAIRNEITKIVTACKRNGCSCDIVLKDITTVQNNPQNLFRWEQIAMEIVNQ